MTVSACLQIRNKTHDSISMVADTEQDTWQYQHGCRYGTRHMAVSARLQIRNKTHGSISTVADTNKACASISMFADMEQGMW
jgi:hypothetical protein